MTVHRNTETLFAHCVHNYIMQCGSCISSVFGLRAIPSRGGMVGLYHGCPQDRDLVQVGSQPYLMMHPSPWTLRHHPARASNSVSRPQRQFTQKSCRFEAAAGLSFLHANYSPLETSSHVANIATYNWFHCMLINILSTKFGGIAQPLMVRVHKIAREAQITSPVAGDTFPQRNVLTQLLC